MFWGKRGVFWGGLWGLFFGGQFMAVPVVGHAMILGHMAHGTEAEATRAKAILATENPLRLDVHAGAKSEGLLATAGN